MAGKKKDESVLKPEAGSRKPDETEVKLPTEAELAEELGTIYATEDLKPDMSRLTQTDHSLMKRLLIGLVVFFAFLSAVSWAGFFFFSPADRKFSGDGVSVEITGPATPKSGELVTYTVSWKNGEKVPLGTATLELRLPEELTSRTVEPPMDEGALTLGSLAPGSDGEVTVTGVFLAPVGKQADLQAVMSYRPADFNSQFQKVATRTVSVEDSVMGLSVTGPTRAMAGDEVTLDFSYINTTESEFSGLKFGTTYPTGFIPKSSEPAAADAGFTSWSIEKSEPNSEGHIKIIGTFASDAKGKNEIKGSLGFVDSEGVLMEQKNSTWAVEVVEGELVATLVLNGKGGDQPASFGDTLHYAVSWKNTGTSTLEDVSISLVFEAQPDLSKVLVWSGLKDKQEGAKSDGRITWSEKQITALGKVRPGDEGTVDLDIPLLSTPLSGETETDYSVTAKAEASIQFIDSEPVSRTVQTPPLKATLSSDAKLASAARYFDENGVPIGSGPLPPKVGEATSYRVCWKLDNTLHDLADLKLSARLPTNVSWTGKQSVDAGSLSFDAAEEKMKWTLNWMPTTVKSLQTCFDLSLTPTSDQSGKVTTLVDASILEARDKANGNPIILSSAPLTTDLENDENAEGKGRVQP
jgi:hypothetical protein